MMSPAIQIHSLIIPYALAAVDPAIDVVEQYLSIDELKRYERYLAREKKIEFFLARKFIKELLASLLDVPSGKIELVPDDYGKPFLLVAGKKNPIYFNLSHTSGLIACAISRDRQVGIDVEFKTGSHDDIVQQFFHPQEVRAYQALSQIDRIERFYTIWTLKEAYLKAVGRGLHFPLNSFWFLLSNSDGATTAEIHFEDQKRDGGNSNFQFFLKV